MGNKNNTDNISFNLKGNNNINKIELNNNNLKGIIEVVESLFSDDDNIIIPSQQFTDYFQKRHEPKQRIEVIVTYIPLNRNIKDKDQENEKDKGRRRDDRYFFCRKRS